MPVQQTKRAEHEQKHLKGRCRIVTKKTEFGEDFLHCVVSVFLQRVVQARELMQSKDVEQNSLFFWFEYKSVMKS